MFFALLLVVCGPALATHLPGTPRRRDAAQWAAGKACAKSTWTTLIARLSIARSLGPYGRSRRSWIICRPEPRRYTTGDNGLAISLRVGRTPPSDLRWHSVCNTADTISGPLRTARGTGPQAG